MYHTKLQVICDQEFSEILMAEIAEAGFDTFMETEKGFEAYVEGETFDHQQMDLIREKYSHVKPLIFFYEKIQKQNWNEEWEKNVEPVVVENKCLIRADFHKIPEKYPYEIIITPKMSFGTGHHQTTYLMIKAQLDIDHRNKRVMDAGCGTAILSVMASKLGAKEIEGFDIDEWSVINGRENCEKNSCHNIRIYKGKIGDMKFAGEFDLVLANINKNILLDEMKHYAQYLKKGGLLLLSGFYTRDWEALEAEAFYNNLKPVKRDERETWATLLLQK